MTVGTPRYLMLIEVTVFPSSSLCADACGVLINNVVMIRTTDEIMDNDILILDCGVM